MIGDTHRGKLFSGLFYYLTSKSGSEIIGIRNLPECSPETIPKLMQISGAQSKLVTRPVYHLSLSCAPGDRPLTNKEWLKVAKRVLKKLGMEDHQALIVRHKDRAHDHIHLIINRVHPETGKANRLANDYAKIMAELRSIENDLGLKQVPKQTNARCNSLKDTNEEIRERKRKGYADTDGHRQAGRAAWSEAKRAVPGNGLTAFQKHLLEHGFCLARGDRRGTVIVGKNGKVASMTRCFDSTKMERQKVFGEIDPKTLPSIARAQNFLTNKPAPNRAIAGKIKSSTMPLRPGRILGGHIKESLRIARMLDNLIETDADPNSLDQQER